MSSEARFTISKAPLVPTKHDAASASDCRNIVVGLFQKLGQQIVGDSNVVCMTKKVLQRFGALAHRPSGPAAIIFRHDPCTTGA